VRLLVCALALAAGCHNVYVSDDEGAPRPSAGVGEHPDELSLPYALGTQIGFTVHNTGEATAWQVVSDSPGVFAILSYTIQNDGTLSAQGQALAEGDARLRVLDGMGREQRSSQVSVSAADRARIFSHGDLRVLGNDASANFDSAEVTDARVLVGGTAVFPVAYYKGAQRVYGRGIASGFQSSKLLVEDHTSSGAPTNEWLFVTASAPGSYTLSVQQGSAMLEMVPLTAVAETDLGGLSLATEPTTNKHFGDDTWALARAVGTDGREVLGVYTGWTLDGVPQLDKNGDATANVTQGDLYRFKFGQTLRTLTATRGALTASAMVPADSGYVADTTYLGCAAAPGRPSVAPLGLLASLLLLACGRAVGRRS
jgi:hypothetical protein